MSSFASACEGEACWAAGWLQHSFTISSNVSSDAVELLAVGLEGPLTSDMSPDSFPTRYVPFHPSVIVPFFVLIGTVLLHELYASHRRPILANHEKSSNTLVQAAFLLVKLQMMIYVAMMVPISLDFCLQMGLSATMSGFFLSSPLIGGVVGTLLGKGLTSENHWNQPLARRLLVLGPMLAAVCILGNAYLLNTAADRSMSDRALTFWMSLLLVQVQVVLTTMSMLPMNVMQNKMTPNSEKTFWMMMGQCATNAGMLIGPGVFGILAYSVKGGQPVSPSSLFAWVNLALGINYAMGANYISWVLPSVLVPSPEENASAPEAEVCVAMLPAVQREQVVKNMVWYTTERQFSLSAIEVGTIMLLEVSYGWSNELSAMVFTVVSVSSLIFSLISSVMLSSGWVTESVVFFGANCLGLVGVVFLFDFGTGPAGLLLADGMVYGMTSVCNGLSEGWASKAAMEYTGFSVEVYRLQTALALCVARFLSPIFTRTVMDFGGRNIYASMQFFLVVLSTWTVYKTVKMVWDDTSLQGDVKALNKGLTPKHDLKDELNGEKRD